MELYDRIVDKNLLIRRITVTANNLVDESRAEEKDCCEQLNLFTNYESDKKKKAQEEAFFEKEKRKQKTTPPVLR